MKKLFALLSTLFILTTASVKAEMQFGFGLMAGQISADGTETEGTAADSSDRSKSFTEFFAGADIFIENSLGNGMTVGLSYVPIDFEIGSGERSDSSGGADIASEADTGTRTAQADVSDLLTLYTNIPVGGDGWYGLLGGHMATIKTSETLPNSSYGNEDIFGLQVGLGRRVDDVFKVELYYSDFEDIEISSTGGGSNSVSADADALTFRVSFGF